METPTAPAAAKPNPAPTDPPEMEDLRLRLLCLNGGKASGKVDEFAEDALRQMRHMADRLDAAESLRTHFLSHARNELNNPVTAILGLSARLAKTGPEDTERIRTISRLLNAEALALSFHLENIFAAADLEAGAAEPEWSWLNPGEIVAGVVEEFHSRLEAKALALEVQNGMPAGEIVSDAAKLRLILVNLLANAAEFSHPGGRIELTLAEASADEAFTLTVQDEGRGIPEAARAAIFDRFSQGSAGFAKAHPGLGLGLTVVKGFIEGLSGEIVLSDTPGGGSRFTARIPSPPDISPPDNEATDGNEFFFGEEEEF